jgi:hypothetical protein
MTNIRQKLEYLVMFILTFFKMVVEWLPYLSVFILIGAIIYGLLSHFVGCILMMCVPVIFLLLKAWADIEK